MAGTHLRRRHRAAMHARSAVAVTASVLLVSALVGVLATGSAGAAVDCVDDDWVVVDEALLNEAIACFNAKPDEDDYSITLLNSIFLTSSTTPIDNDVEFTTLTINGDGFDVVAEPDVAAGITDIRPFEIAVETEVTFDTIGISGGRVGLSFRPVAHGGGILNYGTLRITDSTITDNAALAAGGGIANIGGEVYIYGSSIIDNEVNAEFDPARGGGIDSAGGSLVVHNSTISGNDLLAGSSMNVGAGISAESDLTLDSVTLTDNFGATFGSGLGVVTGQPTRRLV